MKVLVTGGAGYIGSHTCVSLLEGGHEVIIVDDFSNSSLESIRRVEKITGHKLTVYEVDLKDYEAINDVFERETVDSVIHFAAYKAVGESVSKPIEYYTNNISGTLNLLDVMRKHNVKNFVFSSSATVYGDPITNPITEDFALSTTNPYGSTKLMTEMILKDIYVADNEWNIVILRYFNPIGAHESGLIGEDPAGIPNNLVPYIAQVAVGKREKLSVFGNDYDTHDGTGVRDYIHVVDLAEGHVAAISALAKNSGLVVYNLGTGHGYSVLDIVKAYEKASGVEIPYVIEARRPGDIATCYADPSLAKNELNWEAKRDLNTMCVDSWRWQSMNPNGYTSEN
ncbi:UDP-glucose 4-epimerase GalE [Erysipelothrix sp. HDW6A]|uniref:UDP-glucose 4-epimerase GalE n=1 Tax=Erysipelothrix sp. HDW6A TaxID=2714928 RepID=UPI0014081151|nr:UDP-glucose 4-epimerase GalE [Erysipelothrix sp. HDW6A]QIK57475.1 UDP-glucose 4-epimerase GalE [Erysipelothrix sp. HDW6A]